ncbi:hypothetical protein CK203_103429 [Vitis vinifera]|uniref:Uncharacterized protein n=1 Tax=Vitis vinifera TaxID=29760 RepID=A0A438BQR1_VITVI|nr:hypothetical protein CK203_103429 [Vitis vinifera]
MHIKKNVCESIIGTLLNIPGKTNDGLNCRLDLVDMGLRSELAPKFESKRTYLPPACYSLSKIEKKVFCETLSQLKVPYGYCSNLRNIVSMEDLKLYGLKSDDYHTLMQQLLSVSLRSILPKHVRNAICRLSSFFNALCSKVVDVSTLDELQNEFTVGGCTHLKEEGIEFYMEYLSNVETIGIPSTSNIDQKVGASLFEGHTMKVEVAIANEEPVSETLKWIAHGPSHYVFKYHGYVINGCHYHTKERDDL